MGGVARKGDNELLREAVRFVREALGDGEAPAKEVTRLGIEAGFRKGALNRAKDRLGITSHRVGAGPGSYVLWRMPSISVVGLRRRE